MTSRSDLPRLGASLGVLGTLLERDGQTAFDRMSGWRFGPRKAPAAAGDDVCTCGHTPESHVDGHDVCTFTAEADDGSVNHCTCVSFTAAPMGAPSEDRKTEQKQRARAAEHFDEYVKDLAALDELAQRLLRKVDIAVPPNPEDLKNRRTGDFEPWTPAEIVAAGWCATCWLACQAWSPIPTDAKGYKRWKDRCGWCGAFRAAHGIDPPKDLIVKHHDGRNLSAAEVEEAVTKAKEQSKSAPKGKKGRRSKKAKAAA